MIKVRSLIGAALIVWITSAIVLVTGHEALATNLAQLASLLWIFGIIAAVVWSVRADAEDQAP